MTQQLTAVEEALGFRIPTGKEIYDHLMGDIEPELVTDTIPALDEKYKDETEEQKEKRKQRYKAAFDAYHKAFDTWIANLRTQVDKVRKTALRAAEEKSFEKEAEILAQIESSFSTSHEDHSPSVS